MTRHDPAMEAGPSEAGTSGDSTAVGLPRTVGTFVRTLADPELVAADLLERMGPVMAGAVAVAVLDLVDATGRVIA